MLTKEEIKYSTRIKLKNRRVFVEDLDNNEIGIRFQILTSKDDAKEPSAKHDVFRGVIKSTAIRISHEAAEALFHGLGVRLAFIINDKNTQSND